MVKAIDFPRSILVRIGNIGEPDHEYLAVGTTPSEIGDDVIANGSVKTARYVLAGTGVIHQSAPLYVEDTKS